MDQGQNPYGIVLDLINQAITFVQDPFACAGYPPRFSQKGVICKTSCCLSEKLVHVDGGQGIGLTDVIEDFGAVLLGGRDPENLHSASPALTRSCARFSAKRASSSAALA